MTHGDIKTKFLIEYDKANITSSYPSLTDYEIATILDKAYLALIAQKLTGNNLRQMGFEDDIKAIEDIQQLIKIAELDSPLATFISNLYEYDRPDDMLYYLTGLLKTNNVTTSIDNVGHVTLPVNLVSHESAKKFMNTMNNLPWIPEPVCYEESNKLCVLIDSYNIKSPIESLIFRTTYIKYPAKFATENITTDFGDTEFELNDSMAEEFINLAISMALETVESTRLATKLQTRQLEA